MLLTVKQGSYSYHHPIKLESSLCDYSDACILVTGNITFEGGNQNTKVAFKNCSLFKYCRSETNDTFDSANFLIIQCLCKI